MGIASLVLSVAGIVTMMIHYVNHSIALGVVTLIVLAASLALGLMDMKHQEKNGGIKHDMFNPGVLGHGIGGIVLVVGSIMCIISNVM